MAKRSYINDNKWKYLTVFVLWTIVVYIEGIVQYNSSRRETLLSGLIIAALCTIISIVIDAIKNAKSK